MSFHINIDGKVIPVISEEEEAHCELCGKLDELRPYGPKGERICFDCGMKNRAATEARFREFLNEGKVQ